MTPVQLEAIDVATADGVMDMLIAEPGGVMSSPGPAILLAFHREGLSAFTRDMIQGFAAAGYVVGAPNLYHRSGDVPWQDAVIHRCDRDVLIDMEAGYRALRARASVDPERIIVAGHCQGGRVALLAASLAPERFQACLAYYSSGVFDLWGGEQTPFELLDGLRCPVAGFFGQEDKNPSPDDVGRIEAKLRGNGVACNFHRYPGAGHAFMSKGTPKHHAPSEQTAWQATFEYLEDRGLAPIAGS